jgi:hypothetical protein
LCGITASTVCGAGWRWGFFDVQQAVLLVLSLVHADKRCNPKPAERATAFAPFQNNPAAAVFPD